MAVLVGAPAPVAAHSGCSSYLYLDLTDDELGGRVEMPFADLRTVFGYGFSDFDPLRRWQSSRRITPRSRRTSASTCGWAPEGSRGTTRSQGCGRSRRRAATQSSTSSRTCPVLFHRELDVGFDPFFDEIEDRTGLLLIGNDSAEVLIDDGKEHIGFDPSVRERRIDLGDASQWNNFTASVGLGVDHIRTGPDHILFVLVLLLPSVLVFAAGWHPVTTFGSSLWRT